MSLPISLMSDMFDCITLDVCEALFDIVEKHVATWTSVSSFIYLILCVTESFKCGE